LHGSWEELFMRDLPEPGLAIATATAALQDGRSVLIARSQERLEHGVDVFGIVECFDASMEYIAKMLGWDPQAALRVTRRRWRSGSSDVSETPAPGQQRLPPTNHRAELTNTDLAVVEAANSMDMELLQFAKALLHRRMYEVAPYLLTC